jgi:hypothetical protein
VGLHRGLCRGRDLYRDHGPDRRSGPTRLDLPEALEVLLARPPEWRNTRQPAALVTTRPKIAISSSNSPLRPYLRKLQPRQATAHDEDRTGSARPGAVPIRTLRK